MPVHLPIRPECIRGLRCYKRHKVNYFHNYILQYYHHACNYDKFAGNHIDIVQMILEHKPNVNALDKDGCTALTLACKEGYHEIAVSLINCGAYINMQVF